MQRIALTYPLMLVAIGCPRPAPAPTPESTTADDGSPREPPPTPADALSDVIQIGSRRNYTCALLASGEVDCWGWLAGIEQARARPSRVKGIESARRIAVGRSRSYAVDRSGDVLTWGGLTGPHYRYRRIEDPRGQWQFGGPDSATWRIEPTEALDPAFSVEGALTAYPEEVHLDLDARELERAPPQWRVTARAIPTRLRTDGTVFVADEMMCTHDREGALACARPYFFDAFPSWNESQSRPEPNLVDMATTSMPEVCLLRRDGSVECVREPEGDAETWGTKTFRVDRLALPGPAAAIASGDCGAVVLRDGRVVTWCDSDEDFRLLSTTRINPDIDDAVDIASDSLLICVLRRSDDVTCWWEGDGARITMPTPRTITTLDHPTQLAVGSRHACALVAGGHVQCWGGNEHGQLGNGSIEGELDERGSPPSLIPDTPPTWVVAPEPAP